MSDRLSPLFTRLYLIERPIARVVTLASTNDDWSLADWGRIQDAFDPLREETP